MAGGHLAVVSGFGAQGALGLDAWSLALCARAGKLEPRPTRFWDRHKHPIGAARMMALPDDLYGAGRLEALAVPPLREAARPLFEDAAARKTAPPLIVALPEAGRPD